MEEMGRKGRKGGNRKGGQMSWEVERNGRKMRGSAKVKGSKEFRTFFILQCNPL